MKETSIEKKLPEGLRSKGQYAMVFGVIALMLYVAGFPLFLLFFVGILTFFIWKLFSGEGRHETRQIFEFYLSANEILREDERRWYGFEIKETILRGENILRSMNTAPPLVHFALGALYHKVDDHGLAVKHLSPLVEDSSDESAIVFPTKELREYVHMLRKIERAPAEAPLTSAAIRSLERMRKNRAKELWEVSRFNLANGTPQLTPGEERRDSVVDIISYGESEGSEMRIPSVYQDAEHQPKFVAVTEQLRRKRSKRPDRKSISEVLHEIYDNNSHS